jgi:hypothetical protein
LQKTFGSRNFGGVIPASLMAGLFPIAAVADIKSDRPAQPVVKDSLAAG